MSISKVTVTKDCVTCGMCQNICPDVFDIEDIAVVKAGADFAANEDSLREAADICPVEAIQFEE